MQDREVRGSALLRAGFVPTMINASPEAWKVPSEVDRSVSYIVSEHDGQYACTCEDYRYHGGYLSCKHINIVKAHKDRAVSRVPTVVRINGVVYNIPKSGVLDIQIRC
jgi:hypothetical protein